MHGKYQKNKEKKLITLMPPITHLACVMECEYIHISRRNIILMKNHQLCHKWAPAPYMLASSARM